MSAIKKNYVWKFNFLFNNAEIIFVQYWIEKYFLFILAKNYPFNIAYKKFIDRVLVIYLCVITGAERIATQLRLLRKKNHAAFRW